MIMKNIENERDSVHGYKGFDRDMKCREYQYVVGELNVEDYAYICSNGFHFCLNPFSVFEYYAPSTIYGMNKFGIVHGWGDMVEGRNLVEEKPNKCCCTHLVVDEVYPLHQYVYKSITNDSRLKVGDYIRDEVGEGETSVQVYGDGSSVMSKKPNTGVMAVGHYVNASVLSTDSACMAVGYHSVSCAYHYNSVAVSEGVKSCALAMSENSVAISTGRKSISATFDSHSTTCVNSVDSCAVSIGRCSRVEVSSRSVGVAMGEMSCAKGKIGSWLVLTEYKLNDESGMFELFDVQSFKVDGVNIKEDTNYILQDGKAVEYNF